MANATFAPEKKRRLLVIGQSKGSPHDWISTAMAMLYNLGRCSHHWDTFFRISVPGASTAADAIRGQVTELVRS